jgi:hypothetical protein
VTEIFDQLVVKDRQAELLADAEQRRLARQKAPKEPLVRVRLTIEFQLGRRGKVGA